MTETTMADEVLKTDALGRVRAPRERREALLDEYERSGMSGQAFAGHYGIKYQTLATWVQKRRRERGGGEAVEKAGGNLRLLEAVIEGEADSQGAKAGVVMGLPGGGESGSQSWMSGDVGGCAASSLGGGAGKAMLSFAGSLKVFVALEPCDLRKSFNGLHGLVSERLGEDPRQGALFVFTNRRHTRLKMLYWDGSGLWVMVKRLEEGTFSWPKSGQVEGVKLKLAPEALALLTDGIDLRGAKMRPWYERE